MIIVNIIINYLLAYQPQHFICETYKCCSLFIDQLLLLLLRIILMISLWSMLTRVSQSDYLLHWTLLFSISLSTVRHQHQTISNIQDKLWRSRNKNINHQRAIENTFIWDKLYQGLFTITTWVIYYKKKFEFRYYLFAGILVLDFTLVLSLCCWKTVLMRNKYNC